MTRDEFITNGVAWNGSSVGWQTALAHALNVEPRTIRRAVKDGPSDNLAKALVALFGEAAPAAVHAEWICGDGSDGREYLVHTASPKFRCLVMTDEEYQDFGAKAEADYGFGDSVLCGFHWLDRRPDDLASLMERAADAVEAMS